MQQRRLSPEEIDRLVRKRAGAKLGWFVHATVYVVVNLFLYGLSSHAFGTRPWSVFPVLGWGVGLALHGVSVFVLGSGSGLRSWLERREREKLEREHGAPPP